MRARITNTGRAPFHRVWVDVVVPKEALPSAEMTFRDDRGAHYRASRGPDRGNGTVYHVRVGLRGLESITGEFVDEPHSTVMPFKSAAWVRDDLQAIVPMWMADGSGGRTRRLKRLDSSSTHERIEILDEFGDGVFAKSWLKVYHDQEAVRLLTRVAWSDRASSELASDPVYLRLTGGEPLVMHYGPRNGVSPHSTLSALNHGVWVVDFGSPAFRDASGIPVWATMLCLPTDNAELHKPENRERTEDLIAHLQGGLIEAVVIDKGWNGSFLAFGWVPDIEGIDWNDGWQQFERRMEVEAPGRGEPPHPIYADRPIGLGYQTSEAGGQGGFGAVKGAEAVSLGDPRWIIAARESMAGEFFRGVMHHEADGSILRHADHPKWRVWNGNTHFHGGIDWLGKRAPGFGELTLPTGWYAMDDQHRSLNVLCSVLQLTDDPMLLDLLHHQLATDEAIDWNFSDATRAIGRLLLSWSHAWTVVDEPWKSVARGLIAKQLDEVSRFWRGGKHENPVRLIIAEQKDPRTQVTNEVGEPQHSGSVWQHALAAIGFLAARSVGFPTDEYLQACLDYVVHDGTFEQGGKWWICDNVYYDLHGPTEGMPLEEEKYYVDTENPRNGSPWINCPLKQGGTIGWSRVAIQLAQFVHPAGHPTHERAKLIVPRARAKAGDVAMAEWLACMPAAPVAGVLE